MKPSAFEYLAPETCEEALGALAEHGDEAAVLAGGQSLIPMMNLRIAAPRVLVDVMRIPELQGIRSEGNRIEVSAGVRMAEAERDVSVPLLQRALRHVGHPAIRNCGTVCGSVAHADPTQMTGSIADPLGQLSQGYADAVTTTSRPAFAAVSELLGHGRILFGSDYSCVPIAATAEGLRRLELDTETLDAIGRANAAALLGER